MSALPAPLPPGERLLWQGRPDWRVLARTAFHARAVGAYFGLLTMAAAVAPATHGQGFAGVLLTAAGGGLAVGLLHLLAWWSARTSTYLVTDRRIVLDIGMALPKCINLPLTCIGSVDLALRPDGSGDLALGLTGPLRVGYAMLWPHARPWRVARPHPTLRALPDAALIAALVSRACQATNPGSCAAPIATVAAPTFVEPVAA